MSKGPSVVMDDSAKAIKPIGDRVLIKLVEVKRKDAVSKSGIIMPGKEAPVAGQTYGGSQGVVYRAYIHSVGEKVNLEEWGFKINDWVIFNNYDMMAIDLPNPEDPSKVMTFGLTKPESIWGVYEE